MKSEFSGILGTQLAADGLFNIQGHLPRPDEFSANFSEITADVGLLHLGQGGFEVPCFNQSGLGPLRDSLIENEVADVA
jgi:hypothetical protein